MKKPTASFTLTFECPNCGALLKEQVNVFNNSEVTAESLVSERSFNCPDCGCKFATPPDNELYQRI